MDAGAGSPTPHVVGIIDYAAVSAIFLSIIGALPVILTTVATLMAIAWYMIQYREHRAGRKAELLADAILAKANTEAAHVLALANSLRDAMLDEARVQAAALLAKARVEAAKVVAAAPPTTEATAALVAIVNALPTPEPKP